MRILLFRDASTPAAPPKVTSFLTQLVRQAAEQGHELRELISHDTHAGKGIVERQAELRRQLDGEVLSFDPQVIHVHGLGAPGHLALESGVPYLVSVFGDELAIVQSGAHLRSQAQQALENAGRIVVDGESTRRQLEEAFGMLERIEVVPQMAPSCDAWSAHWLWPFYEQVLAARRPPGA